VGDHTYLLVPRPSISTLPIVLIPHVPCAPKTNTPNPLPTPSRTLRPVIKSPFSHAPPVHQGPSQAPDLPRSTNAANLSSSAQTPARSFNSANVKFVALTPTRIKKEHHATRVLQERRRSKDQQTSHSVSTRSSVTLGSGYHPYHWVNARLVNRRCLVEEVLFIVSSVRMVWFPTGEYEGRERRFSRPPNIG
jgi:hypothetical protein